MPRLASITSQALAGLGITRLSSLWYTAVRLFGLSTDNGDGTFDLDLEERIEFDFEPEAGILYTLDFTIVEDTLFGTLSSVIILDRSDDSVVLDAGPVALDDGVPEQIIRTFTPTTTGTHTLFINGIGSGTANISSIEIRQ